MKTIRTLALAVACAVAAMASAHDFTATVAGQTICFKITNKASLTAIVTYHGSIADKRSAALRGEIEIPDQVRHEGKVYKINGISAKAFAGATQLESIIMPSTVQTIGHFAFEGCTNLKKVVFPGNPVKMGEGVFFKCRSLTNLSLGSEWTELDLRQFCWSDSLTTVRVPAKVTQVRGFKTLRNLKTIIVDDNNKRFSSVDGVLYNKNFTTLYCVPRAQSGAVTVKQGTAYILPDALTDCVDITTIAFPKTLKEFSFRSTSRMTKLESLTFENPEPPTTAKQQGKAVFVLQVANPNVKIYVPSEGKKTYTERLVTEPGEFVQPSGNDQLPYMVTADNMPKSKNIKKL
ncbi:MAG: leucine-rich repeat domain-containing protein [Bacteroidaceae bacterium]|nr:leucine-rich repeat domain-containing protein [Bacteroidaceae bacterium]